MGEFYKFALYYLKLIYYSYAERYFIWPSGKRKRYPV